ncbi:hypothetical protein [Aliihoeflea sp. PC F10.4]
MFTISAFSHLVDGLVAIHRHRRNEALLNDLSDATRRDIGLPERYSRPVDYRDAKPARRARG